MKWLENLVGVIAVIYPLSAIPQIIEIWLNKNEMSLVDRSGLGKTFSLIRFSNKDGLNL